MSVVLRRIESGFYQPKTRSPGHAPVEPKLPLNASLAELMVYTADYARWEVDHKQWKKQINAHFAEQSSNMEKLALDQQNPLLVSDVALKDFIVEAKAKLSKTTDEKEKSRLSATIKEYERLI